MSRILLVDDRSDNRYLLRTLLQAHGYEVVEAPHGAEALALAHGHAPDLVISDLLMPVMDGYTLMRRWRSDPRLQSIPFVVYTATYVDAQDEQLAMDLGADAFLVKPAEPDAFLECVRGVIERAGRLDIEPRRPSLSDEDLATTYSEVLIRKLEEKAVALQEANDALQRSEALYRSLFAAHPEPLWVFDVETLAFLAVNDAAVALYGWAEEEFTRMSVRDLIPDDDQARLSAGLDRASREGLGSPSVWRHRRRDGTLVDVEVRTHSLVFEGRPARVVLVTDITERRQAELRGRESARLAEMASTLARMGGWDVDLTQRTIHLSDEVCRIHEVPPGTTLSIEDGFEAYAPEWRERMRDVLTACGRQGVPFDEEVEVVTARGRRVWVRSVGRAATDETGVIVRVEGAIQDITERRKLDEELQRHRDHLEELVAERTGQLAEARRAAEAANRAKSAFLANMSHEIRTPMNGVLGMVEVLGKTPLTDQQAELVATIQESGRALLGIIDDILDFSKIEAGRIEIERRPLSVENIVEGVAESLLPVARQKGVDLDVFVAPEIPPLVVSDEVRLRQMLYNLLGNAIKFSSRPDRRGKVRIDVDVVASDDADPVESDPLRLTFIVNDNGIGMAPEVVARLFTPFTQAETATTRRFGGSGLGLTICRRLADLMHGDVTVTSRPDAGATFTLTLPFELPARQPAPERPDLTGLECLVVESPDLDATAVGRHLRHAGAGVRMLTSLDTALLDGQPDGDAVIIMAAGTSLPRFADAPTVRQVLVGRGRRRRPRLDAPGIATLDGHPVRRQALLQAVAIAAGRETEGANADSRPHTRLAQDVVSPALSSSAAILVAEDDEVNRKVILKQLELLGCRAEVAANGVEALRKWRDGRFDLLLTDLHMPLMDGYTLAQEIRRGERQAGAHDDASRDAPTRRRPIVALTANALRGEDERALGLGIDDYLTKPLQLERLRETLARWLPRPGATTPSASVSDGTAVFDRTALENVIGCDPVEIREFLRFYLESASRQDGHLREACAAGDVMAAGAIAHKLVSSSRSVGALRLARLADDIERTARSGDAGGLRALAAAWPTEFARATAAIRRVLEGEGGESW